jgi:hypothetical protein
MMEVSPRRKLNKIQKPRMSMQNTEITSEDQRKKIEEMHQMINTINE